jgi:hypothetical protein
MATILNASSLKESLNVDGYNLELTSKRDLSEGKNNWLVLNNVKNKLIHRIFAVVRDGQMYEKQYVHPLKQVA